MPEFFRHVSNSLKGKFIEVGILYFVKSTRPAKQGRVFFYPTYGPFYLWISLLVILAKLWGGVGEESAIRGTLLFHPLFHGTSPACFQPLSAGLYKL
jgi:hypothetical protein